MTWTDTLLGLEPTWCRAPSAHNTQPWVVRADGPERVVVGWDPARTLPATDPMSRDLYVSLGAVVEAMAIALREEGLGLTVEPVPDPAPDAWAVLTPGPAYLPHAFTGYDLQVRRTARVPYLEPGPTWGQVDPVLAGAGLETGTVVPVDRMLVDDLLPRADRHLFADREGIAELRTWLRLAPGDPRADDDGLTADCLGLGRLETAALRVGVSRPVHALLRATGGTVLMAEAGRQRGLGTVVALTSSVAPDPARLGLLGRDLLRAWLALGRAGWATHPVTQLLDCASTAQVLQQETSGTSVVEVWRVGTPTRVPARSARIRRHGA